MSWNKMFLQGNLGKDPETKYTGSGATVTTFSVASSRQKKVDGQYVGHTTWYRCTAFGKTADAIREYFQKGSPIMLIGEHEIEEYVDRDGNRRYSNNLIVSEFHFVGKKSDNQAGGRQGDNRDPEASSGGGDDEPYNRPPSGDEIPF